MTSLYAGKHAGFSGYKYTTWRTLFIFIISKTIV